MWIFWRKAHTLANLEHIVLLTVMRLGKGAYGAVIRAEIERVTGRSPRHGRGSRDARAPRKERIGFVVDWRADSQSGGGKAKRHFKMEGAGA